MTISQVTAIYSGLSTDTKPVASNGVPTGSLFIETDTQNQYVWTGSAWTKGSSSLSQVQFLQSKSDAGKLIFANGTHAPAASTVITSYTPATGNTFVLVNASVTNQSTFAALDGGIFETRNNGSITDYLQAMEGVLSGGTTFNLSERTDSLKMGDTLIGNSSKTYDIFQLTAQGTGGTVYAALQGYLE